MLAPEMMIALSKIGFMSPSGRCRTFDASADGFIRGEGCGVVVLKRLSDAISDNDPFSPSSAARRSIRTATRPCSRRRTASRSRRSSKRRSRTRSSRPNASVSSSRTARRRRSGDPIEVEALAATVGAPRADGSRCYLGSAKANLGHLEAAAGVAGLIKATLVLAARRDSAPTALHKAQSAPVAQRHVAGRGRSSTFRGRREHNRAWPV